MSKAEEFISQSYSKLQTQTGIDRAVWSHYFNGNRLPSMNTLRRLAEIAKVPLWDLVEAFSDRRRTVCEKRDRVKDLEQR